jgi:hypothetical protein
VGIDLVLRELASADLASLLSLYAHLHARDDAPPEPARHLVWESIMANCDLVYVGGFVGTSLVSACNAAIIPNLTHGARPYALIENVVSTLPFDGWGSVHGSLVAC